jgi:hypothetical protein
LHVQSEGDGNLSEENDVLHYRCDICGEMVVENDPWALYYSINFHRSGHFEEPPPKVRNKYRLIKEGDQWILRGVPEEQLEAN